MWYVRKPRSGLPFLCAIAILSTTQLLVACSLAPPPGRSITISLPQGSGAATGQGARTELGVHGRGVNGSNGPIPTDFSSFNCFAINVTAADIPNSNLLCPSTQTGIIAGFVPATSGSITINVPDGSARTFQLFGVTTNAGVACPNLANILSTTNNQLVNQEIVGVGQPYLLGSSTIDIQADTALTIDASFNSSTPQVFQNCGGGPGEGPGYPPTSGYRAQILSTASPGSMGPSFQLTPGQALGMSELASSVYPPSALSAADLAGAAAWPYSNNSSSSSGATYVPIPIAAGVGISQTVEGSTELGYRAAIQLQWDSTGWDLTDYPYGVMQIAIAGGSDATATCSPSGAAPSAAVSVYDAKGGYWIPFSQANQPGYWQQGGQNYAPVPTADLLFTKADGKKYLIVNIESNYAYGPGGSQCSSSVLVAGASYRQLAQPIDPGDDTVPGALSTPAAVGDVQMSNAQVTPTFIMPTTPNASFGVLTYGGIPPYHYSVASSVAGGSPSGEIDAATGHYVLLSIPSSLQDDVITVTDSAGTATSANVGYVNESDPTGLAIVPGSVVLNGANYTGQTITAGACLGMKVSAIGFGGNPYTVPAGVALYFNVGVSGSATTSTYYMDSTCGTPMYDPSIQGPATTSSMVYFRAQTANQNPGSLYASTPTDGYFLNGNYYTLSTSSGFTIGPIAPGPATTVAVDSHLMPGGLTAAAWDECLAVPFSLQDSYGNNATTGTSNVTVSNSQGNFYTTPNCSSAGYPTWSGIVAAGTPTYVYYYPQTTGNLALVGTASGGYTFPSMYPDVVAAGAIKLTFFYPDGGGSAGAVGSAITIGTPPTAAGCVAIGVAATTASAVLGSNTGFISLGTNIPVFQNADCDLASQIANPIPVNSSLGYVTFYAVYGSVPYLSVEANVSSGYHPLDGVGIPF